MASEEMFAFSKAKLFFNMKVVPNEAKWAAFNHKGAGRLVKRADVREKPTGARIGIVLQLP